MHPHTDQPVSKKHIHDVLPRLRYEGPHKTGIDVAEYYGFHLIQPVKPIKEDRAKEFPPERVALLRKYLETGMDAWAQPVMMSHTYKVPYQDEYHLRLEALGSKHGAIESTLIHTARAILHSFGKTNVHVHINSVGGRDSVDRFTNEIANFYKKHYNDLEACCQEGLKSNAYAPFTCTADACAEMRRRAPKPINYLSEVSRRHFFDIVESLEELDITYSLKEHLLGDPRYNTRTVFEIVDAETGEQLALGERYDNLAKKAGLGRTIPAAGVSIMVGKTKAKETIKPYKKLPNTDRHVYMIQLSPSGKRNALQLVERLREAQIPLTVSFGANKLSDQMVRAKQLDSPIIVIIGHKEWAEGTAIVRKNETRAQKIVPQSQLPGHLKRLVRSV